LDENETKDYILTIDRLVRSCYVKYKSISEKWSEFVSLTLSNSTYMCFEDVKRNFSDFIFSFHDPHFALYTSIPEKVYLGFILRNEELWYKNISKEKEYKVVNINGKDIEDIFIKLSKEGIQSQLMRYKIMMKENIIDRDKVAIIYKENNNQVMETIYATSFNSYYLLPDLKKLTDASKLFVEKYDGTTIIKIPNFSDRTIIHELESQMQAISESDILIIDLRMNTGGKVDVAKEFVSLFICHETELFLTVDREINSLENSERVSVTPKDCPKNMNIFVIQNEYTASAAEYIAICALLKNGAMTIGTRTAGFSNQASKYIFEDNSSLELTSKLFVDSSGNEFMPFGFDPSIYYPMEPQISNNEIVKIVRTYHNSHTINSSKSLL